MAIIIVSMPIMVNNVANPNDISMVSSLISLFLFISKPLISEIKKQIKTTKIKSTTIVNAAANVIVAMSATILNKYNEFKLTTTSTISRNLKIYNYQKILRINKIYLLIIFYEIKLVTLNKRP
jgi:hypothetical protein